MELLSVGRLQDNRRFVEALRRRMGPGTTASDPMEAAYLGVHLWAHAVQEAGTTATAAYSGRLQTRASPRRRVSSMSTRSHSTRGRPCESAGYELTASSISSGTLDDPFGQRHFQRTDPEPSGKPHGPVRPMGRALGE